MDLKFQDLDSGAFPEQNLSGLCNTTKWICHDLIRARCASLSLGFLHRRAIQLSKSMRETEKLQLHTQMTRGLLDILRMRLSQTLFSLIHYQAFLVVLNNHDKRLD